MVSALVSLYQATDGPNWKNNSNWMVGEPCQNAWYGVFCCPIDLPFLDLAAQQCTSIAPFRRLRALGTPAQQDWSRHRVRSLSVEDSTAYCQSTITGYDQDIAPCVVTQLLLNDNGLRGDMTFDVPTQYGGADFANFPSDETTWADMRNLTFYMLANVDFGRNDLYGTFPIWITELFNLQRR